MLPLAGPLARKQSRHDAVTRVQSGRQIRHGHSDLDRWPISRAGNMHQAKLGLDHHVISCPLGVGSCLAIARDGGVDQGGVDAVYRVKVQTVLLESSWYVVLDEYITLGSELVQDLYTRRVLERQSQGFFVPVDLPLSVSLPERRSRGMSTLTPRKYAASPGPLRPASALYSA